MNIYPTARAVGEPPRHRRRFLDWRFLSSLTVLLLVALMAFGAWRNYEIREAEAAQKDRLLVELVERSNEINRLEDRLDRMLADTRRERRVSQRERRAARQERAHLLRQQETMLRLLRRYGAPRRLVVTRYALASSAPSSPSTSSGSTSSGATSSGGATSTRQSADTQRAATKKPKKRATQRKARKRPTAGKSGKRPGGKAKGLRRR